MMMKMIAADFKCCWLVHDDNGNEDGNHSDDNDDYDGQRDDEIVTMITMMMRMQ